MVSVDRRDNGWTCRIGKRRFTLSDQQIAQAEIRWDGATCHVVIDHVPYAFTVTRGGLANGRRAGARPQVGVRRDRYDITSPMPARVVEIHARPGMRVTAGQPLVVVEAMKMQNNIAAPADGTVVTVAVAQGQAIEGNQLLVTVAARS
ncbi:MAG: biotin/lipoyl-binding protein [Deltaproteobacteria bacterium]|nr:biotin/lipoyl-binding protein [Deltaproteobacteria bacterium]